MSSTKTITITRKQAEDMVTLIDKNTPISLGVIKGFLQTQLGTKPSKPVQKIDFCNSDRV